MPPRQAKTSRAEKILLAALVIVAIGITGAAVVGKHGLLTYVNMKNRYAEMQEECKRLRKENERLRREIKALRTDPEAIEKVARRELGMIKPDEVLYKFKPEDSGVEVR